MCRTYASGRYPSGSYASGSYKNQRNGESLRFKQAETSAVVHLWDDQL